MEMTKVESKPAFIKKNREDIYRFLSEPANLEKIIPAGKIEHFTTDGDTLSFGLDAIGELNVRLSEKNPFETLVFESEGKAPFSFLLQIRLESIHPAETEMKLEVMAGLNPVMKTMIGGYLQKGLDRAAEELTVALEQHV